MKNKETQDYLQDLSEIRSMMERSSKFMSLSGWAGILVGFYALIGSYIAYTYLNFNPESDIKYYSSYTNIILLAVIILILSIGTAIFFSYLKAKKKGEKGWNATSRRLLTDMALPLIAGGILILIFINNGLLNLTPALTLLFYGLALYNAGRYTYEAIKVIGIVQIIFGLLSAYFIEFSLLIWAFGFGVVHIVYGIYMYFRYER